MQFAIVVNVVVWRSMRTEMGRQCWLLRDMWRQLMRNCALTSEFSVKNQYGNQDNQYYARFDNRWIRLGLRFKFGNTKLETNESIKELEERERLNKDH